MMNYGFTKQFSTENAARYFARVENRIEKWPTALEIHIGYIHYPGYLHLEKNKKKKKLISFYDIYECPLKFNFFDQKQIFV